MHILRKKSFQSVLRHVLEVNHKYTTRLRLMSIRYRVSTNIDGIDVESVSVIISPVPVAILRSSYGCVI